MNAARNILARAYGRWELPAAVQHSGKEAAQICIRVPLVLRYIILKLNAQSFEEQRPTVEQCQEVQWRFRKDAEPYGIKAS